MPGGRGISAQPFACWEPGVAAAGPGPAACQAPLPGGTRSDVPEPSGLQHRIEIPLSAAASGTVMDPKLFLSLRKRALKRILFLSFA